MYNLLLLIIYFVIIIVNINLSELDINIFYTTCGKITVSEQNYNCINDILKVNWYFFEGNSQLCVSSLWITEIASDFKFNFLWKTSPVIKLSKIDSKRIVYYLLELLMISLDNEVVCCGIKCRNYMATSFRKNGS